MGLQPLRDQPNPPCTVSGLSSLIPALDRAGPHPGVRPSPRRPCRRSVSSMDDATPAPTLRISLHDNDDDALLERPLAAYERTPRSAAASSARPTTSRSSPRSSRPGDRRRAREQARAHRVDAPHQLVAELQRGELVDAAAHQQLGREPHVLAPARIARGLQRAASQPSAATPPPPPAPPACAGRSRRGRRAGRRRARTRGPGPHRSPGCPRAPRAPRGPGTARAARGACASTPRGRAPPRSGRVRAGPPGAARASAAGQAHPDVGPRAVDVVDREHADRVGEIDVQRAARWCLPTRQRPPCVPGGR